VINSQYRSNRRRVSSLEIRVIIAGRIRARTSDENVKKLVAFPNVTEIVIVDGASDDDTHETDTKFHLCDVTYCNLMPWCSWS